MATWFRTSIEIALLIVSPMCLGAVEEIGQITLEQAKKYAVEKNYEIAALRSEVEEMEAKRGRAKAAFLPTVGVAGGVDSERSSSGNETASVGYLYGNYNIFNGFSDTYRSEIADFEQQKASVRLQKAEFRVGLDVEEAFHRYIFKRSSVEVKKEAISLNHEHLVAAKKRKARGLVSASDVMEFEIADALLRSELVSLKQGLQESRIQLKKLLGEEVGTKIEPIGSLQHQHLKGSLMSYLDRIRKESEQVLLITRDVAIAEAQGKLWRSKWMPQIDLEVQAGYLPLGERPAGGGTAVSAMAIAKIELFSGLDTLYQKRESEMALLKAEARLKHSILTAVTDMEKAYRHIIAVQNRVDLEADNTKRAKRYYKSVMAEYKRGVKNSSDVKNAAEGYFEAVLRQDEFKFKFLTSRIDLETALGGSVQVELIQENDRQ